MQIQKLSDKKLLVHTQMLVASERQTTEEILTCLQEIQARRLYADLGYSNLFKYLVKELKYSEGAAARRIGALKLVQKVPAARKMIAAGELNLSVASKAQTFCREKNPEETAAILGNVMNKNIDEATVTLLAMTQLSPAVGERRVRVSPEKTRLHLTVDHDLFEKLELLKSYKRMSSDEALSFALDVAIREYQKKRFGVAL